MDPTKDPGISIKQIKLLSAHVEMKDPNGDKKFLLRLLALDRRPIDGDKLLQIGMGFDVMSGIEKPLFDFRCNFLVIYERAENAAMTWQDFSNAIALSHVVPYLREFVSNVTNRMPVPVLILPPMNVNLMLADFEFQKAAAQAATAEPANA